MATMSEQTTGDRVTPIGEAPLWSVTFRNHLYRADDPADEPAYFRREFPGTTREEAHAAAVAYGLDAGDCSPSGGVEDVEGPLWAAVPS